MKNSVISLFLLLFFDMASDGHAQQKLVDAPAVSAAATIWPGQAPANCPFPQSAAFVGFRFTGRHAKYTGADTWYPSWASDDKMYSPWTDGGVNGINSNSLGSNAVTGYATIIGDDPLKLQVVDQGVYPSDPTPYVGRYPCGSLVFNGVWYYGTFCLVPIALNPGPQIQRDGATYNLPWLGPFVGFRYSTDCGKTWTQTPCTPVKPLFSEQALKGEPIKIGFPHFVDFGKNMEHSPDGKAYLVAHGASDGVNRRFGYNSWTTGDEIYLLRVTPGIENMNDASKYEFFDGTGWSKNFAEIKPIAAWRDQMGCVTMTYNAPLKKFLMCVTDGGKTTTGKFHTYILESDRITGPFKLVQYFHDFGEQAYSVIIPSKFISPDGQTLWLCYSANFWGAGVYLEVNPPGSGYAMCLQEVKLLNSNDPKPPPNAFESENNIARLATITASSFQPDHPPSGAVDGLIEGYLGTSHEWVTKGERETAMLRLTWTDEQTIDRVWLFDLPDDFNQITGGMLIFSDGSTLPVGALPDDAKHGVEIRFPAKKVKWMIFAVTAVKIWTKNIGLSEIAVFRSSPK